MATIGIEWCNDYHGRAPNLINNDINARGFSAKLLGTTKFDYGDDLAWDQDFENGPENKANGANIVFFSGHGTAMGPLFGTDTYKDGIASPSDMRLGGECKWVVFDACEVLQDLGTPYDAVSRLKGCFIMGLHAMLGFHTACTSVSGRGELFARALNDGSTVLAAWLHACEETESGETYCAFLFAKSDGVDTEGDYWYEKGEGSVSVDPDLETIAFDYGKVYCGGS
jgi:hypothetical protein